MDRLENMSAVSLTVGAENLVPGLVGNRIERRLLDGTLHIQTIGNSTKEVAVDIYSYAADIDAVNSGQFGGEKFKLHFDDKIYTGKIKTPPAWNLSVRGEKAQRIYKARIIFVVESELVI